MRALRIAALSLGAALTLHTLFPLIRVQGISMEPALKNGRLLLGTRVYHLKPGDIVAFKHSGKLLIKRVRSLTPQTLYLLGDNAPHSTDSRHFGPVSRKAVVCKILGKH